MDEEYLLSTPFCYYAVVNQCCCRLEVVVEEAWTTSGTFSATASFVSIREIDIKNKNNNNNNPSTSTKKVNAAKRSYNLHSLSDWDLS